MTAPPRVLREKGGFLSPAVTIVEHEGRPAILKDYRRKNVVVRNVVAPVLVRREYDILRHLEGIAGIPRAIAVLERRALLVEYVDGKTIGKFSPGELPDVVYHRLAETVRAMHRRGVAHLDLRQRKNIVVAADRAYLVDFANALRVRGRLPENLRAVDESGLLKFKERVFPHLVTEEDRAFLRTHRFLRRFWIFSPRGKSVR